MNDLKAAEAPVEHPKDKLSAYASLSSVPEHLVTQYLNEFKSKVSTPIPSDLRSLQFLRAYTYKVDDAVIGYEKQVAWRREHKADTILDNKPAKYDLLHHVFPAVFHGFTKAGQPIFMCKVGSIALQGVQTWISIPEFAQCHVYDQEYQLRRCKEGSERIGGHTVETLFNIVDLKGLSLSHRIFIGYLRALTEIDERNYPETLGRTLVINAPWIFESLWAIIRRFLDPVVASKVDIISGDYKTILLDLVDSDQLPVEYGGTCVCKGRGCIPEYTLDEAKEFLLLSQANEEKEMQVQSFVINAGKEHIVEIKASGPAELDYYFSSNHNNILFSISWLSSDGDKKIIIPEAKCQSQSIACRGIVNCESVGTFVLKWRNRSWFGAIDINYHSRLH